MSNNVFTHSFAAISLSLIALIILPHGELIAFSEKYKIVKTTNEKDQTKTKFYKYVEELITGFKRLRLCSISIIFDRFSMNLIKKPI